MTAPHVRRAAPFDTGAMAALLNAILAERADRPATARSLRSYLGQPGVICHLAEAAGDVAGFQWIEPGNAPERCHIATFMDARRNGPAIGSALFDATRKAARLAGHRWIRAEIRADNADGLIYYQSRGFERIGVRDRPPRDEGPEVRKILLRFDL